MLKSCCAPTTARAVCNLDEQLEILSDFAC